MADADGADADWPDFMGLSFDDGVEDSTEASASPSPSASPPLSSPSAAAASLSAGSVGAWLQQLASSDDATIMGRDFRFVRTQVMALAKQIDALQRKAELAAQKRRFVRETERQRAATSILPPVDTDTPMCVQRPQLAAPVEADGGETIAAVESAAIGGESSSTALSVVPSGGGGEGAVVPHRRRVASTKVKKHLQSSSTPVDTTHLNKHALHDLGRTVRQLRHMAAQRCYVCKAPFDDATPSGPTAALPPAPRHARFTNHCTKCGERNHAKRHTLVDLRGRVAVLTGARIKIGYQTGIRLLRCGATLLATTRFPANALLRYRQEPDYDKWAHNLHLLYADLCNPQEVLALAERIKRMVPHVDILINNAAQTVRRPLPYYQQLASIETQSQQHLLTAAQEAQLPVTLRALPPQDAAAICAAPGSSLVMLAAGEKQADSSDPSVSATVPTPSAPTTAEPAPASSAAVTISEEPIADAAASSSSSSSSDAAPSLSSSSSAAVASSSLSSSAASSFPSASSSASSLVSSRPSGTLPSLNSLTLARSGAVELPSQVHTPFSLIPALDSYTPADSARLFPPGQVDTTNDHEPLDLRAGNSWSATSEQVDLRELAEVLSVNAMAPFALSTHLLPHMKRAPTPHRYIIHVSSMEGKLNRCKPDQHAHTNMAKAALNALTRTVAADYAAFGIYVNSVDTGWNSEERAVNDPKRDPTFETPLDCADGAARVLDPIFTGELEKRFEYGQFLKDFMPSEW